MRIISGQLGGRIFSSPNARKTHPMSDKMRGALFNILGDISGRNVLDAFAGSGALSFEALSRGAATALAIDNDRTAQQSIAANTVALGLTSQLKLIKASADAWLSTTEDTFDIILLDPPYQKLQLPLVERLAERLKLDGTLVLSWPGGQLAPIFSKLDLVSNHQYGDSQMFLYQNKY